MAFYMMGIILIMVDYLNILSAILKCQYSKFSPTMVDNFSAIWDILEYLYSTIQSFLQSLFECNLCHFRVLIFKIFSNHDGELFECNLCHFRVPIFKISSNHGGLFECNLCNFRVLIFKLFSNHGGLFEYNSDHSR